MHIIYLFIIIIIYVGCAMLRSMTPKPDDFRALGVKQSKDLLTRVKKATKLNLATLSIKENFHFLTRTLNA
jgi:hypothetical protein